MHYFQTVHNAAGTKKTHLQIMFQPQPKITALIPFVLSESVNYYFTDQV